MQRKTLADIGSQWDRLYRRVNDRARARAALAHPETGGHPQYCHNWGNADAKRAWSDAVKRTDVLRARYRRTFEAAEHRRHGSAFSFVPLWCALCSAPEAS